MGRNGVYLCGIEQAGRVVVPNQVVQGDASGCAGASKVTFPLIETVPSETRC
jgi:D-aminopeptidase